MRVYYRQVSVRSDFNGSVALPQISSVPDSHMTILQLDN